MKKMHWANSFWAMLCRAEVEMLWKRTLTADRNLSIIEMARASVSGVKWNLPLRKISQLTISSRWSPLVSCKNCTIWENCKQNLYLPIRGFLGNRGWNEPSHEKRHHSDVLVWDLSNAHLKGSEIWLFVWRIYYMSEQQRLWQDCAAHLSLCCSHMW